jgi:hypothetical protein
MWMRENSMVTSRQLIEFLQQSDPEGNLPVCVANLPIKHVLVLPAYYDGRLQDIDYKKPELGGYREAVKARFISSGSKINIIAESICDALLDNPFLTVLDVPEHMEEKIAEARESGAMFEEYEKGLAIK